MIDISCLIDAMRRASCCPPSGSKSALVDSCEDLTCIWIFCHLSDYLLKRRVGNSEKYSEESLAFVQAAFDDAKISNAEGDKSPECYGTTKFQTLLEGRAFASGLVTSSVVVNCL
jgi:hypothetical protein